MRIAVCSLSSKINQPAYLEMYGSTPYIDFHANNSSADWTARIIASGNRLSLHASDGIAFGEKVLKFGSTVMDFNNGETRQPASFFGITSKPDCLVMLPQSQGGIATYDWDNSTVSSLRIMFHVKNSSGTLTPFTGMIRFGFICFG